MAKKTTVSLLLKHAVVLGDGHHAITQPAGSVVEVDAHLAPRLLALGAATAMAPKPEPEPVPVPVPEPEPEPRQE